MSAVKRHKKIKKRKKTKTKKNKEQTKKKNTCFYQELKKSQ